MKSRINAFTLLSGLILSCVLFVLLPFSLYTLKTKNVATVNAATATITFSKDNSDVGYILYNSTKIANPEFCSKVIVVISSLTDGSVVASTVATISGTSTTFTISSVTTGTYKLTAITPTYGTMVFDTSKVNNSGIFTFTGNITITYDYYIDSDIWFTGGKVI